MSVSAKKTGLGPFRKKIFLRRFRSALAHRSTVALFPVWDGPARYVGFFFADDVIENPWRGGNGLSGHFWGIDSSYPPGLAPETPTSVGGIPPGRLRISYFNRMDALLCGQ